MLLVHTCMIDMLRIPAVAEQRVGYISIAYPEDRIKRLLEKIPFRKVRHLAIQNYLHISMALRAWRMPRQALVIIMEFYPKHMLFAAPLFKLCGRRIAFVMHGSQQAAIHSASHRLALWYYKLWGFVSILLEIGDEGIPASCRVSPRRRLVLPLTTISDTQPRLALGERLPEQARIRIGIVGMLRKGKPYARLLERLAALVSSQFEHYDLVVGTPAWSHDGSLAQPNIEVIDTDNMDQYFSLLRSLDIFVADFEHEEYFYRGSASIVDALSCGCHVVCPDFPVLNHQVTWPTRVGTTFTNPDQLEAALTEAVSYVRANGQDAQWRYREKRDWAAAAQLIDEYLADHGRPETQPTESREPLYDLGLANFTGRNAGEPALENSDAY